MNAQDSNTIISEIHTHIQKQGGKPADWYVGLTSDIAQRLFIHHKVPKKDHWYIYRQALSAIDARVIEKAFLDWGCDGGPGGGDVDADYVYAYLKTAITEP